MWSIRVLSGPQIGQIFDLKMGKNVFGRGGQSEFKISSIGISKEHCEIHVYKDKVIVVDLKSSNGTFVNGVKIQNSMIKLGDKVSLFDVIMDVIPTPDIRPKASTSLNESSNPKMRRPVAQSIHTQSLSTAPLPQYPVYGNGTAQATMMASELQQQYQNQMYTQPMEGLPSQGGHQDSVVASSPALEKSLWEKIEIFIENTVMPAIYQLAFLLPFKQVLLGFIIINVVTVTLLSMFPLSTIMKESNFIEASKRAKSVARTLAKANESFLLSGQLGNLSVQEALKEDGIKEALIIQQADGAIVAPTEKAGRESSKPFIAQVRKEARSLVAQADSKTIVASHPIGAYDPISGETSIRYHALVYYDISSLNVEEGRIISLLMQTLVISSVLGLILFFLFSRLISFPLKSLNQQIDTALREKSDRTEVKFDDPEIQKIVANVNLLLNRMWNGLSETEDIKPQQNKDIEFSNMVEMLTQPALVVDQQNKIIACNHQLETLIQMSKEQLVQHDYTTIVDPAFVQNLADLIGSSQNSLYEKHSDRIPFSQFECEISLQAFLDSAGLPAYYFITLTKVNPE